MDTDNNANPAAPDTEGVELTDQDLDNVAGGHTWPIEKPDPGSTTPPWSSKDDAGAASDKHGAQLPHTHGPSTT